MVGLIPCAHGGSPIKSWSPGGFHDQTQGHPYDDMLLRVRQALPAGTLKGVLWHQGESDANEKDAPQYESKLAVLIDRIRTEFASPELPFVIGQLGNFPDSPWSAERLRIDAAHQRLAKSVLACAFVPSLGLNHRGDKVHFDSASYREFGHRYFSAYQQLNSRNVPRLLSVQRIWDKSTHNAFTDLVRFKDEWFCVFREGDAHVSDNGALRVLRSRDGIEWSSAAVLTDASADLRDAKISVAPDNRLMLSGAGAMKPPADFKHQSLTWLSTDGVQWSPAQPVGERDMWIWRSVWNRNTLYGIGYRTNSTTERYARLYKSTDGINFETLVDKLFEAGYPNESAIVFLENGVGYCLLRRDPFGGDAGTGQFGTALSPFTHWQWKDLGVRVGGPQMIALPGGKLVAAVRLYDGHTRT